MANNNQNLQKIYVTHHKIKNLKIKELAIPQSLSLEIIKNYPLEESMQIESVNQLVDHTTNWMSLDDKEQIRLIENRLLQENVVTYLLNEGYLLNATDYSSGIDSNGTIVVRAFETTLTAKEKRIVEKSFKERDKNEEKRRA